MSNADNIVAALESLEAVDKEAKRKEDARARAAASRLARKRTMPAEADVVAETIVLCLMDLTTLPPSKRAARSEVIADVMRQAHLTLEAMGHPDVHHSMMQVVHATAERLRTEKWHHPLNHGVFKSTPQDTGVTPTARGASDADRIANSTRDTDGVRTD